MATFTNNITSSSSVADIAAQFDTWAAQLAQLTVADNFTGSFAASVADITNALSALGGTLSGNLSCDDGVTIDGEDVSELGSKVTSIETTVNNDVVSKSDIIIQTGGPVDNGTDLYTELTDAHSDVSTTTHNIYYALTGFVINALTTDANYTLGNISGYVSGSTITMAGTDRNGVSIDSDDLKAYYLIIAIPK